MTTADLKPKVSIHIVHQDSPLDVARLLASLHAAKAECAKMNIPILAEIEVFDDGSSPRYAQLVEEVVTREQSLWEGGLRYHRDSVRRGFAAAHNECLKRSRGRDFVFFVGAQMTVGLDFFFALRKHLSLAPEKPRIFLPAVDINGKIRVGGKLSRWTLQPRLLPIDSWTRRNYACGNALMVGAKVFAASGGWNKEFKTSAADVDLSLKLLDERGWEVHVMSDVRMVQNVSLSEESSPALFYFRDCFKLAALHTQGLKQKTAQGALRLSILNAILKALITGPSSLLRALVKLGDGK